MKKPFLTIALLLYSALGWTQSKGDIVSEYLPITDKDGKEVVAKAPLPPGSWHVVSAVIRNSSGGNTRAVMKDVTLDNIAEGRVRMALFITARVNNYPIRWEDDFCTDFPRLLSKNDFGTRFYKQKCIIVWMNTFLQSQSDGARSTRAYLDGLGVKYDSNQIGFSYGRHGDIGRFLIYELSFFPSNYGLDNPVVTNLSDSPYYPANIQKSPEKAAFAKSVMAYAESVAPQLDDFYFGKETAPLPEFKPN
ncbi:MAG: hypothetical protein K0M67_02680 [Thiobacillus sp.]|nr:hypothetical protein [Thiobacillus sp.]